MEIRMKQIMVALLVVCALVPGMLAQEKVAVKPPSPRTVGPPPLPFEPDVLRYVFDHFPEENRDEVMAFIGKNFKSDLPVFKKLANEDARKATSYMLDLVSDALLLMEIAKTDKELAGMMVRQKDLERKAVRKAKEVAMADESEKKALTAELKKMLEQAFDAKQQLMKRDLNGMEKKLKELSDMISKRDAYREKIIEKKLDELTVEENYLKW
jgi:hypothetical protein